MTFAAGDGEERSGRLFGAGSVLHRWTTDVSDLVIVPSRFHGTDMLSRDSPKIINRLETEMLAFVDSVAEREPRGCADR